MLRRFNASGNSLSVRYRWKTASQNYRRLLSPLIHHDHHQNARHLTSIPTVLLPPIVFGGLVVALWTWKCVMMVVFQNKIIYMPGLPPNARRETIEDYENQCGGIVWTKEKTVASDGTEISLCVSTVETGSDASRLLYILYFQGNASSLPPRLPFLSQILRMLRDQAQHAYTVRYKMVCCSYRGYWTSKGRPSESGIMQDTQAALRWIEDDASKFRHQDSAHTSSVAVWGQSIGAGFASKLVALSVAPHQIPITTLILETPFLSIKSMLETLYPQKWLPYRYLSPFLRNHLDTPKALEHLARTKSILPRILILDAGKDELVPVSHADQLELVSRKLTYDVTRYTVAGALHTEAIARFEGRKQIVEAIRRS